MKNGRIKEINKHINKNYIKKITFKQLRNVLILSIMGGFAAKSSLPVNDILLVLVNQIFKTLQIENVSSIEQVKKINAEISRQYQLLMENGKISNNNQKINNENNLNSVLMGAMAQAL